jgi:phospholipid/cholesterol/gamma-HCH transport system substrate-binding protein
MAQQTGNNVKLGLFVLSGMAILVISLYLIGKNQSFWGSNLRVKVRFHNVNGLMEGNNVRYSGIQAGTVKSIIIMDDTTIEVTMLLNKSLKSHIRKNALANIGTEGLMGNKVINITPNSILAPPVEDNDLLTTQQRTNTDEIIQTLSHTNSNLESISEDLAITVKRINNSQGIWRVFNDTTLGSNLHNSLAHISDATERISEMSVVLNHITNDLNNGKGTAGLLLSDQATAGNLKEAMAHINSASKQSQQLIEKLNTLATETEHDLHSGHGIAHDLLRDSTEARKLSNSLSNIEKGTAAFNEDMEALKHNFFTKGYFKKEEKKARKKKKAEGN